MTKAHSSLADCLAYEVLLDWERWLGGPSPTALQAFLYGAQVRAELVESDIRLWRIAGPLREPEFSRPFVDATGHPKLTIRWATALEMTHFSRSAAMLELRHAIEEWFETRGFGPEPCSTDPQFAQTEETFWTSFTQRSGMYVGAHCGRRVGDFLRGMVRGGDWLGLASLQRATAALGQLESSSTKAYGSPWAFERVHDNDPKKVFEVAGLLPVSG